MIINLIQASGRKVPKSILGPETKVRRDTMKSTRHCMLLGTFLPEAVNK
jgi:hypothetical protein